MKSLWSLCFFATCSLAWAQEKPSKGDSLVDQYKGIIDEFSQKKDEKKQTIFYQTKHTKADNLAKLMENFLSPKGTVAASKEADIVVIEDVISNIANLKKIADEVDQFIPKIVVEARIVEFTIDSDFEKEVEIGYQRLPLGSQGLIEEVRSVLNTPGANPNPTQGNRISLSPYENRSGVLNIFLRYMQSRGKANILNATNLTVMRGEDASITTGEEVPILTQTVTSGSVSTSTEFKSVGTKLHVKPIMIVGKKVRLEINPEVSTVTSFASAGEGISNPVIAVRNAKTTLDIIDGQMLSIGGLLSKEQREVERRVPFLSEIPVLGWFFRSRRLEDVHTQVVIFLNIKILDEGKDFVSHPQAIPAKVQQEIDAVKKSMPKHKNSLKDDGKLILDEK